ncbi:MAG: GMC family oxidoreductase [Acidobacteria bacterium]|nr:GMC family oxidoreductase [Acidobacteriota bacterium]
MSRILIIGAGAGGATVARELAGRHTVTVVEAGGAFRPYRGNINRLARARATGLFFDERLVRLLFPAMQVRKTRGVAGANGMILVNGVAVGGTTTISAGNALRCDEDLRRLGIDLDVEFDELAREVPVTRDHRDRWTEVTRRLAGACTELGLDPRPIPKLGDYSRCRQCGRCVLGCPNGAKWDARRFLDDAVSRGATVETGWKVDSLVVRGGLADGIQGRRGLRRAAASADLIVLAAGGAGTPAILERSDIRCEPRLFVDPILCVAAPLPGAGLDREISMPFVVERDRYIVSPYMDWLSFFFNQRWRLAARDIVPLMIKLADDDRGRVGGWRIEKSLTEQDQARLADGVALCHEILERVGAPRAGHFLGTVNAGHPGGALPAGRGPQPFHDGRLPENVWVADASLIPVALGRPPILTIMAMAKRVARLIAGQPA